MLNDLYELKNIIYRMKSITSNCSIIKNKIFFLKNEHIYNLNNKISKIINKIVFILLSIEIFFAEPFLTIKSLIYYGIIYILNNYIVHNKFHNSIVRLWGHIYNFILIILILNLSFNLGIDNTIISLSIILFTLFLNKKIIPFITFNFFSSKINYIDNTKKVNDLEIELSSSYKVFNDLENKLNSSFLPSKYRNIHAIEFFIYCLENARADTLKELINLYENELRYQEDKIKYNSEINRLKTELEKTKKIAQKARSDANFSIFLSRFK